MVSTLHVKTQELPSTSSQDGVTRIYPPAQNNQYTQKSKKQDNWTPGRKDSDPEKQETNEVSFTIASACCLEGISKLQCGLGAGWAKPGKFHGLRS